jgi:hypothetical protein
MQLVRHLIVGLSILATAPSCRRTVVVERPVEVLVPVAPQPVVCVLEPPPARPLDVFVSCNDFFSSADYVACVDRASFERLVRYLNSAELRMARDYAACGPEEE